MKVKSKEEADQLYGRMMEDCEIQHAIESGQFESLSDVLDAVKARSESIQKALSEFGSFDGVRSLSKEEYKLIDTEMVNGTQNNWELKYVVGNPETRFKVTSDAANPQRRSKALAGAKKLAGNDWRVWVEHTETGERIFESEQEIAYSLA